MAYSGGKSDEGGARPVGARLLPEEQIAAFRRLADLIEARAPPEEIAKAQEEAAKTIGADRFQVMRVLPHFVQAAAKNVDASRVYEHFHLPGRDRLVHDRREGGKKGEGTEKKEDAKYKGAAFEVKEGRLVKQKERDYENYLGDRMGRGMESQPALAPPKEVRPMSKFEETILSRFEGGGVIAKESHDGRAKFLAKTEAQWREFFAKFLDRITARKVSLEEIREFLFRGLIPKGNKGVAVSDMILSDGRVEKFIRFSVVADALARLKTASPGDVLGREGIAGLTGEEFLYLTLAVSRGREMATSPLPAAGKFVSGLAEEKAAQELGLLPHTHPQTKGTHIRARGKRSFLAGLFGEGEGEGLPYQFIPWWHWANLKKPVRSRWATIAFYISLLAVSLIGIAVLTYRLLSGGL